MDKKIVKSEMQPVSAKLVIVQGVVDNLPEIVGRSRKSTPLIKKSNYLVEFCNLDLMN